MNKSLLSGKAFYFVVFAALASFAPFVTLYYEQIGLTGRQIGVLTGLLPLIMLFGAPLFGALADATQRHKLWLNLSVAVVAFTTLSLSFTANFFWLMLIVTLYGLFFAPILPLVDRVVLDMLGPHKDQYGKQRLWGAIGWGIMAPAVGVLTEQTQLIWIFYIAFAQFLLLLGVSFYLPVKEVTIKNEFWLGVRLLTTSRRWVVFLFVAFIGGTGLSVIHNYLFLYMNGLGANKILMGVSLTVATISEMAVMFFASGLLRRWGTQGVLLISLLVLAVRLFAYAYVQVPEVVLIVQLLHGPTFATLWIAGVAHADNIAPVGMGTTAQGLFSGVTMGLGSAFGGFIGGVFYDSVGSALMFQWVGWGVIISIAVFVLADKILLRIKPVPTKL